MQTTVATPPEAVNKEQIETMFKAGFHFGMGRSRRHPTVKSYIYGVKNNVEIFDLEQTLHLLEAAKTFIKTKVSEGSLPLLISGKNEGRVLVADIGKELGIPYVAGRWIGGTITNFNEIKKRIVKLAELTEKRSKGELNMYTKKERLLIDREIENLEALFGGLATLKELPKFLILIDPRREETAVAEARTKNIPIVALASSDCDLAHVTYSVPGNDASYSSITFFLNEVRKAIQEGKMARSGVV